MDNTNVFMNEPLTAQEKSELRNRPLERLMANFARGNFDVTAEEIFNKKADAEDKQDITILSADEDEVDLAKISTDVQRAFKELSPEDVLQTLAESAKWAAEGVKWQKHNNPTQYGLATKIDQLHGIEKRLKRIIEDLTEI